MMRMKFYLELFENVNKFIFIFCYQNELCKKCQLNETLDTSIEHTWIAWLNHLLTVNDVRCTILDFHFYAFICKNRAPKASSNYSKSLALSFLILDFVSFLEMNVLLICSQLVYFYDDIKQRWKEWLDWLNILLRL